MHELDASDVSVELINPGAIALRDALVDSGLLPADDAPLPPRIAQFRRGPRRWVGLMVAVNREEVVTDRLRECLGPSGWLIYWPNYVEQIPNGRGGRRSIYRALLPGYVFACMPMAIEPGDDPWGDIHNTPGVRGFVRDGLLEIATLPEREIIAVEQEEAEKNRPQVPMRAQQFEVGNEVTFVSGNFAGQPGTVLRLLRSGRVQVEVKGFLGRAVPFNVWPHRLTRA